MNNNLSLEETRRRLESGRWLFDPAWGWIERGSEAYARLLQLRWLEGDRQRKEDAEWRALYADIEREAERLGMTPAHLTELLKRPGQVRKALAPFFPPPKPRVETKSAVEVYEVKSSGLATFKGYLAVFGNQDAQGDIVERGAFKRTLEEARERPLSARFLLPVLLQHDTAKPVGAFTELREDIHGLAFAAELNTATRDGADAYQAVKAGYLSGMSIGFVTRQHTYDHAGVRHLTDVKLIEGSLVTFPANDRARVSLIN